MYRRVSLATALMFGLSLLASSSNAQMSVLAVPTQASLIDLDTKLLAESSSVVVGGYTRPGDGGGGSFIWQSSSSEPPDEVVVIAPHSGAPGRWIRQGWNGQLVPEVAGAVGNGESDDVHSFDRLVAVSRHRGAFTITLTPGKRYYLASTLDLSVGAPGLIVTGPGSPRYDFPSGQVTAPVTRLDLNAQAGANVKLGSGQVLKDVMIWRHGLTESPRSLDEVRQQVATWFSEDGERKPLSLGVAAPFDDAIIEGCRIVGFHTGIRATGGRFTFANDHIDTAGYAVEVSDSKATSLIENLAAGALWSRPVQGHDAWGDSGYRPGTAYYIHGGADGLQMNSVGAEDWVTGIWFDGTSQGNDWLISLSQPDIETPPNNGAWTAAIKTTGAVRRLTIIDPRIVSGGLGTGASAALDFGHTAVDPRAAANNNVTVIGGSLEAASKSGTAVLIRSGATGMLIGVTMNLAMGGQNEPLVRALAGAGKWVIANPDLRGSYPEPWLEVDPSAAHFIKIIRADR